MSNNSASMISGWPDAIRCVAEQNFGPVYLLQTASSVQGELSVYAQVYPHQHRYVAFNPDGSYHSRGGDLDSSKGCIGQSISQLHGSGKTFGFGKSDLIGDTSNSTMFSGWPDIIKCSAEGAVFWLSSVFSVATYNQVFSEENRYISFNSDGSYNSRGGDLDLSKRCLGQSIKQLRASYKVGDLVLSRSLDESGSSTMIKGWPDAIRCNSGEHGAVFFLHSQGADDTFVYSHNNPDEYRYVIFNSDGSYNSRSEYEESSKGCLGQSIPQLYNLGMAFNFVGKAISSTTANSHVTEPSFIKNGVFELSSLTGNPQLGFTINGIKAGDYAGVAVSSAGDVNGDGIADIVVSRHRASPNGLMNAGQVYVIFGSSNFSSTLELSNINGKNGFIINGVEKGYYAGEEVAIVRDINGDGVDDLAVGAPMASFNEQSKAGKVYIVFGTKTPIGSPLALSSLNGSNGFVINGVGENARFGVSIDSAGDFNDDGFNDIIVGSSLYANDFGRAYIVFGSSKFASVLHVSSLDKSQGIIANGFNPGYAGNDVASAGDFNNDGINDVIIGARGSDVKGVEDTGQIYLMFGGKDYEREISFQSLDSGNGIIFNGISTQDILGYVVGSVGDVNGDGIDDIAIGSSSSLDHAVCIVFGNQNMSGIFELSNLNGINGFIIEGIVEGDRAGNALGAVGDINQDGIKDLLIGVKSSDANGKSDNGQVYVVYGRKKFPAIVKLTEIDETLGFSIHGIANEDRFGQSLVSLSSDINRDGRQDLIIGAYLADPGGRENAGQVYVIYSSALFPEATTTTAISEVTTQPSFIKNGVLELSSLEGNPGLGLTINGIGSSIHDNAGFSVSSAGDINGDGRDDVIIGARHADVEDRPTAGQAYVVFGGVNESDKSTLELSSLDGTNGFTINGINSWEQAGYSVSSAGDVNGDGKPDIIIGARYADLESRGNTGRAFVVFGKSIFPKTLELSSLDGKNGFAINGIEAHDETGVSVSSAGDVNGDGFSDVIVGAYGASIKGEVSVGKAYVIFGNSSYPKALELSSLDGNNGFVIKGIDAHDHAGYSVSSAGDFNGDSFDDVIVGARLGDPDGKKDLGEAYVVFGNIEHSAVLDLSSLNGTNGFTINGINTGDRTGASVSSAGDLNGDGFDDIVVGAPEADGVKVDSGKAYVVFGRSSYSKDLELSSLDGNNGFVINAVNIRDERTGISVGTIGDINRDGLPDIIVGAMYANANGETANGQSYVILGKDSYPRVLDLGSLNKDIGFTINGPVGGDLAGCSVSSAGDMDGDGKPDIIIGAYGADPGGRTDAGQAYVLYSSALFPETTTTSSTSSLTSSSTVTTISSSVSTITETSTSTTLKSSPSATTNTDINTTNLPTTEGQVETTEAEPDVESDSGSSSSVGLIVGLVTVVAVIGVGIGFLIGKYKSKSESYRGEGEEQKPHDDTMHLNPMFKKTGTVHEYENTGTNANSGPENYEPYVPKQQQSQETPQIDMDGYVVDDNTEQAYTGLSGNTQHYDTNA